MKNKTIIIISLTIAAIAVGTTLLLVFNIWNQPHMAMTSQFNTPHMRSWFNRGFSNNSNEILTISEAENVIEEFLLSLNDPNLALGEIMIFDNHAYTQIVEKDSGIGAMELLIDPESLTISPEMGPNMMWNVKYGHMGRGMSGFGSTGNSFEVMSISEEEAVDIASEYLQNSGSGLIADEHATAFYGYYTLHTLIDDEIHGMLSVNGYSGQVFIHTWHGNFISMSDHTNDNH